jgi:predicted transglutaminase-like cysteine proteinase
MAVRCIPHALLTLPAAAAATLLFSGGACAQAVPARAASLTWLKSDAILGAPSALHAILAQQQDTVRTGAIVPASFSAPRLTRAVIRETPSDEGILSGRPDVFGSVALQVMHTPLDSRWRAVQHQSLSGAPARFSTALKQFTAVKQLELANRYVNHRVHYQSDEQHFGRPDVWSSANETLRSGSGDCEDYAIAKLQLLRAAGFPQHDLYLVIVHDLVRRADHAVLVARAAGNMFVLDDGTDEVLNSRDVTDYRPVLTFASYGKWTHGYRVQPARMVVAENRSGPAVAPDDDQRSRSASLLAFNTGFSR